MSSCRGDQQEERVSSLHLLKAAERIVEAAGELEVTEHPLASSPSG
ncbi:hypothetical protein ABZ260_12465 [Streptosporangium sp. NPDC006013]